MTRVLEHMAADHQIEGRSAQLRRERPGAAADVGHDIDIGPLEQVEADEVRAAAEPLSDQATPVTFVAIRNQRSRPDLQDPRRAAPHPFR